MGLAGHVRWHRIAESGLSEAWISVLAYLCLSVREELAFHGFPLRRLETVFGLWVAQLMVALVFATEHVAGGATWGHAIVGAGTGSLFFGMAAIATRGLAVPIGLHAGWNIGDWMRGGKGSGDVWQATVEQGFEERMWLVGMISYVVIMCLGTAAFWWWHRRIGAETRFNKQYSS